MNPLGLLRDAKQMTPSEFLRDFYTRRGLLEKLKDVDALVVAYGHQMPLLYAELDKKCVHAADPCLHKGVPLTSLGLARYGTNLSSNPPPIREEIRRADPTTQYTTPATPTAPPKPPSHKSTSSSTCCL